MNPIKRKKLVEKTADELGMSSQDLDDLVCFYYKSVRKMLSSAENRRVHVPNLGTFVMIKKRLENKRERLARYLENNVDDTSFAVYHKRKFCKEQLEKFKVLFDKFEEEQQARDDIKKKRIKYLEDVKPDTTLES